MSNRAWNIDFDKKTFRHNGAKTVDMDKSLFNLTTALTATLTADP